MSRTNDIIEIGLCECGCGLSAGIAPKTITRLGWIKGQPKRFLKGHHRRKSGVDYIVEDRGFTTPCWTWQRSMLRSGYGMMWDDSQQRERPAHCVYYERHVGLIPNGFECDHLCRNRNCVNPDHIEPVTPSVNAHRGAKTKLTQEQVDEIRRTAGTHGMQSVLARKFGVSVTCVHSVLRGKYWTDDA